MHQHWITIEFEQTVTDQDVAVWLDNEPILFHCDHKSLHIDAASVTGFHLLRLRSQCARLDISRVWVAGCDLRKLIFLSWLVCKDAQRHQPATVLWEPGLDWFLPFMDPVSHWLHSVEKKLPNHTLGQNLFEQYAIFYPEKKITVETQHQLINDFFEKDFDFTVVPRTAQCFKTVPYTEYQLSDKAQLAVQEIQAELWRNRDYVKSNADRKSPQSKDNVNEWPGLSWENSWSVFRITKTDPDTMETYPVSDISCMPSLQQFINDMPVRSLVIYIGILPPGGIIYPHTDDDLWKPDEYLWCSQLYIPLYSKPGNYLKFSGAGTIELDRPWLINNSRYTHAVINTSTEDRFVLGLNCHVSIMDYCDWPC